MARMLIVIGIILILIGILWPVLQKTGLGRLPGDIAIESNNFSFYFPLATSIVVSIVISLLFWLFRK